ncbi:hypothetical protein ACQEVG_30625 [Streptomyces sp. CA-135486]|uniref:hypothetical protein n=1 Tax=Streptomyces sp. CA-135486 TaxID=3240049 RepID=UPI003D8C2648
MANSTVRGPGVASPGRRSMAAAARAAARRTERVGPEADTAAPDESASPDETAASEVIKPAAPDDASQARRPDDQQAGPVLDAEAPVADAAHGRRRGRICAVLAVLVAVLLAAVAVLGSTYGDGRRADGARTQALAAATQAAPIVLSYDYRRLNQDFAAARDHLTGTFRDEYRRTTTTVVAPTAAKYHGVVKATVVKPPGGGAPAASVVSASPDKAVVLLFVNQVTTSTQVTGPRVDLNRVRMTLTRTDAGWKVSAVDAL